MQVAPQPPGTVGLSLPLLWPQGNGLAGKVTHKIHQRHGAVHRAVGIGGGVVQQHKICHYGGSALETLDIDPYDLMTMKAEHVDAGADGLICLPYFTGERAPYWNSELRGMFFGFSLNHSRSHMIRAVMEGICYSLNSVMAALKEFGDIKDIRVSGSFTKSKLWLQILSDGQQ